MNKTEAFLKKHSSTILTVVGSCGVVVTAVLAVKATPKALELVDEERKIRYPEVNGNGYDKEGYISPLDTVKIAWKPYIPAVISGVSTIACIFGANYLNHRQQASLMSAYALLDNSYKEYRRKVKERYPEESVSFEHEIIKSKFDKSMKTDDNKELFFDYQSMRWFESTIDEVKNAESKLNEQLVYDGIATLNDFYDYIGLSHVPYGYQLGWSTMASDKVYGDSKLLDFHYQQGELDDGLEYTILTIEYPDSLEYIC